MAKEPATPESTALAVQAPRRAVVANIQPLFDTERFEQIQRSCKALMFSSMLPDAVRGDSPEQCFSNLILLADYSERWRIPLPSVAQCVSMVFGKPVFEGKLIDAMLDGALPEPLDYHWVGERGSDDYRIYVWDHQFSELSDEEIASLAPGKYPRRGMRMIDGSVAEWRTFKKNSQEVNPNWTGPRTHNQLAYRGAREWARLYESGLMLGVYGDDEMVTWESARVVGRGSVAETPATPSIGTGFTRPAPIVDAEIVEEPAATGKGSTGPAADPAPVARTTPEPAAGAASPPAGGGKPAEPVVAASTSPGKSAVQQVAELTTRVEKIEEETSGFSGLALDAFEDGHAAGLKGAAGDVPRAWSEYADPWQEGWHAGAAERLQDASDADDAADEEDGEFAGDKPAAEEEVEDDRFAAIEAFNNGLRSLKDWAAIRQALNALSKSEAWSLAMVEPGAPRVRGVRIGAWCRVLELKDPIDVMEDLLAFRCWLEATEDAEAIGDKWQEFCRSAAYGNLTPEARAKLEGIVMARVRVLQAA